MEIATTRSNSLANAIRVEWVTIGWMIVEGGLAAYAGIRAHSLSLVAFGADSFIELISGGFLLWRLMLEHHHRSLSDVVKAERIASWVAAIALALLCVYIVGSAGLSFFNAELESASPLGVAVSVIAIAVMLPLASKKRRLARELGSSSLRADAACSMTCAYMSITLLLGLSVTALTGWSWIDGIASLAFLYWLIPEAREAFEGARKGELHCDCG